MSTLSITVNVTNPDEQDRRAMRYAIDNENAERAQATPPGTPLPQGTSGELKSSYETILAARDLRIHARDIREAGDKVLFSQVKTAWDNATDAKRTAALAALQ
jgi:hypothetical protein